MNWLIKVLLKLKHKKSKKAVYLKKRRAERGLTSEEVTLLNEYETHVGLIETAIGILSKDRRFSESPR